MVSVKQTFVKSYFCANLDLHFSTQMTISTNFKDYYSFSYFQIIMSSFSVQLYSKGAAARTTKWLCCTVTTVQTGFDQTISSLDSQQRVGHTEVTTAMKLLKKCSGCEYFTK